MPTRRSLLLRPERPAGKPEPRTPTWNQIHGLCCALVGETAEEHDPRGESKPWSVTLLPDVAPDQHELHLNLLDDSRPAVAPIPTRVRMGSVSYQVTRAINASAPATDFLLTEPAIAVRMRHLSPTTLSLPSPQRADGSRTPKRHLPLPEPTAVYRGLARRWNAFSVHPGHRIPDDLLDGLLSHVVLAEHRISTVIAQVGAGDRPGFVGDVVYTLTGRARVHPAISQAFTTLSRYASYAGVGAQTTHGLGAVIVEFSDG